MARWPIRIVSVIAMTVLSYGWGDWLATRSSAGAILLALESVVLLAALAWLYRPGGLAAFTFDDARRAPGEAIAERPPAPVIAPRRERSGGRPERAPVATLWSGERRGDLVDGPLDLNSATAAHLATLPGIGRGAAARVVEHREARGPFGSVGELEAVEGFDAARVARVAGRLRV